jgi:hypothetical protein
VSEHSDDGESPRITISRAEEKGKGAVPKDDDGGDEEEPPRPMPTRMLGHRRNTVSAEVYNAVESSTTWTPPTFEKSASDAAWLARVLHNNCLFKHLDDRELKIVVSSVSRVSYTAGQVIYTQGIPRTPYSPTL